MRPVPEFHLSLVLLCLMPAGALAAKPAKEPADAPPQLISTKGGGPKWKNVAELQQYAAKGDPSACFELADRSLEGDGVPLDVPKAIALFEQAARGGVANGWFRLGKIYHDGLGGTPDYGRALDCFTTAARAGVVEAQHNLGAMLVSARGVKRDYVEGLAWLIVAEKAGDVSEAASQVRLRLAGRPADLTAAETRAGELTKDLAHATVRAIRTDPPAIMDPVGKPLPPPVMASPVERPALIVPKLEPPAPPQIAVPIAPILPPAPPGKP